MKTVGEILKNSRQEKKLTLEEAEQTTKIRKKFLVALEENDWQRLPSLTYIKGFIKNYAEFLNLDSLYVLSIFRRQSDKDEKAKLLPCGISAPLDEPFLRLTPSKVMVIMVLAMVLLFFFWLLTQYQSYVGTPKIILDQPQEGQLVKDDKVQVSGKTDPTVDLTINGQKVELIEGKFNQEINVEPGIVVIDVVATNNFNKKQEIKRTIKVESP